MAKKKETPRERREREKQARLIHFARSSASETPEAADEAAIEIRPVTEETKSAEASVKKFDRKSIAKANGLKSTFLLGEDMVFMTSFGPGSLAQPEKHIVRSQVENIRHTFTACPISAQAVAIRGVAGETKVSLPLAVTNSLHAKDAVEKLYFGRSFKDNVHVQIAYNIMDIRKFFAVYANIICHTVDNMSRGYAEQDEDSPVKTVDADDFLGVFPTMAKMQEAKGAYDLLQSRLVRVDAKKNELQIDLAAEGVLAENIKKRLSPAPTDTALRDYIANRLHFNMPKNLLNAARNYRSVLNLRDTAQYFPEASTDSRGEFDIRKTYAILRILGILRQASFHEQRSTAAWLFRLDDNHSADATELKDILAQVLKQRLDGINREFIKKNAVCLGILFRLYPQASKEELVNAYYRFIIRKDDKNMGFSIRRLREVLLTFPDALFLTEPRYDSVRQKLYNLLDFIIFYRYLHDTRHAEKFVESLRVALTEENKIATYFVEANALWKSIKNDVLSTVVPEMKGSRIKELQKAGVRAMSVAVTEPADLSAFSKAMYAVSLLLDGKDINTFFCALINKLENIASLLDVLKERHIPVSFRQDYQMFERSRKYADDLRLIRSLARMNKGKKNQKNSDVTIKERVYLDAAAVLGEYDKNKVRRMFHLGEAVDRENRRKNQAIHSFRNFIINNMIYSSRFVYVCRFMDPKKAQVIMRNPALVSFILKDMPQTQLERYCRTLELPVSEEPEEMAEKLTEQLLRVNFQTFSEVSSDTAAAREKERLKALIGLYLTVLYLLVKTLVKINASYSMAFAILERDAAILSEKYPEQNFIVQSKGDNTAQYMCLTAFFAEQRWLNPRVKKSIDNNKGYYSDNTFRVYRNTVEHLLVPLKFADYAGEITKVKSLFDVYHYLIFRLLENNRKVGFTAAVKENDIPGKVHTYQTVSKDFLYGINAPLAYNAARYINLSNREQFLLGFGK